MRTKLTCIHPTIKKEWVTGEAFYGELKDGFSFDIPISVCKKFVVEEPDILEIIKPYFSFEIAIGVNGRFLLNLQEFG